MPKSLFGKRPLAALFAVASAFTMAACGGGGGGEEPKFVPPPAPPPSPPPPPPPPPPPGQAVRIFPSVTTTTEFATLGYEATGASLLDQGFSVRYDAPSDSYIFDVPSHAPGAFRSTSENDSYWSGGLHSGSSLWPRMHVLKPSASNPEIQLSYTSFATYLRAGPMEDLPHGVLAFGLPTPASAIPTTGSATMNAKVAGYSTNGYDSITGTATLNFNFGAGTLAGHFDPVLLEFYSGLYFPLGRYTFVDTLYGVGNTTFSGRFAHNDPALGGAFTGRFTGPNAEEMMASWVANYSVPGVTSQPTTMFGVWVGKKCC